MPRQQMPDTAHKLRLAEPALGEDAVALVAEVLASGHLTLGPRVEEFERLVAAHVGVPLAVAVSSGTTALHLALAAMGVERGDEVIVPDFTHPATGNAVLQLGAVPVLVDVDPSTYNVAVDRLEAALGPRTRVAIAVDLFGLPADYPRIEPLLAERGVPLLCDAACSIGGAVNGVPAGALGHAATFSFHPRKVLSTGEGGMVLTSDDALADSLRRLRNHGAELRDGVWTFTAPGYNYRLSDVLAALGIVQMPTLKETVERRNALAADLTGRLRGLAGIAPPEVPAGLRSSFQAYVAVLDEDVDRGALIAALAAQGIEATVGTYALHAEPTFRAACGTAPGDLPVSWSLRRRTVALPLHPRLADADIERIAGAVEHALRER